MFRRRKEALLLVRYKTMQKLRSIWPVFAKWNRYGRPSPAWILRTSSKYDRRFALKHASSFNNVTTDEKFQYVTIDGKVFVWPKNAPIASLVQLLSELLQPNHPHHYDVEPTTICPGDIVLDIGACEGAFAAGAAEKGAETVLIEPSILMGEVIKRLFQLRDLPGPRIIQCLLGDTENETYFLDHPVSPGASRVVEQSVKSSYPVRTMTLDQFARMYLPHGLTYIKCDAEGWDAQILISGRETIKEYQPKIAVTTYHNVSDYRAISDYLESLGYRCSGKGLFFGGELRTLMLHGVPETRDKRQT
jgi:FkbM family methyltransferase